MIKIENTEIYGFEQAIRSMRNPKNSWDRSDSQTTEYSINGQNFFLGENDKRLATTLANAGTEHGKFLRMINVYVDVTAPRFWWVEADTYKVGTVRNSCSTMHKIQAREFTKDDFSIEHLTIENDELFNEIIVRLNKYRDIYNNGSEDYEPKDKDVWWQMIQLLPQSYNQKATLMLNYAVLRNIYHQRRNHKLDEWHTFCDWIETLPYAKELIIGSNN